MTFTDAYKTVEGIPGWMGEDDCFALWNAVKGVSGLIVEIGPFMGRSTLIMAQAAPKAHIIAIDPFTSVHDSIGGITPEEAKKGFIANIKDYSVTYIENTSERVGLAWYSIAPIDFLHIDGDHTYKAVLKDIKLFVPHVKSEHYVYFHDYVVLGNVKHVLAQKNNKLCRKNKTAYYDKEYGIIRALDEIGSIYFSEIDIDSGFARCKRR